MKHEDRLAFCELCKNKDFSPKLGVICSLTAERPSFDGTCQDFVEDPQMITKKRRLEESHERMLENAGSAVVDDGGGASPGKIILSILVLLLLMLKWLIRCDS